MTNLVSQYFAAAVPVKPFWLRSKTGIISFTFDDFPRSALTNGGEILNRYQVGGTYYVAGGLTGSREDGQTNHEIADLRGALAAGHEIACHGFNHVKYSQLSAVEIDADLTANRKFLSETLDGYAAANFSYPFGARSLNSKFRLSTRFATARGISRGLNGRLCDLSDLKANAIYSNRINEACIQRLIAEAADSAAWLIFYTHDVQENPSKWGTHPALFEFAVKKAIESGCQVLPIRNALGAAAFS